MRIKMRTAAVAVATLCGLAACTTPAPPSAPPEPTASELALAVYEEFWTIKSAALAAPGTRDWQPELETVATGQARDAVLLDITNYASLPAHVEGVVNRAPTVDDAADDRVAIVDCVDLGDSRLVNDVTGEVLDDLTNRVQRYLYRAEVVMIGGAWLVQQTAHALDQPC